MPKRRRQPPPSKKTNEVEGPSEKKKAKTSGTGCYHNGCSTYLMSLRKCHFCENWGCWSHMKRTDANGDTVDACMQCFFEHGVKCKKCNYAVQSPSPRCEKCKAAFHSHCRCTVQKKPGEWKRFTNEYSPPMRFKLCDGCAKDLGYKFCESAVRCDGLGTTAVIEKEMVIPGPKSTCSRCKRVMCYCCSNKSQIDPICARCLGTCTQCGQLETFASDKRCTSCYECKELVCSFCVVTMRPNRHLPLVIHELCHQCAKREFESK